MISAHTENERAVMGMPMPDLKPCYGKCERCVWKYNGGCSEWNGWSRREEEVGNDNGQE